MYDDDLKNTILDTLENRVSSIAGHIVSLFKEGYTPNKNKIIIIDWGSILISAYETIDILDSNQQAKLDNIFNKIMKL